MTEPDHLTGSLLHSKLMPPRPNPSAIRRARLLDLLDSGLHKKLVLVTAPTGFGKTTLVRMWIEERGIPSAWVTLDETDNDPVRFWTYLISALRTLHPAAGKTTLAALGASQPPSFQAILTPLINELAQVSQPWVLVLEDYHAITPPEIHQAVAFMVQHLPVSLHLVLVSRREPDLPLGILRARDELLEIEAANLRFTLVETEAFLRETLHTAISPQAVKELHLKTEGWAAGLRLAGLLLQNKSRPEDVEAVIRSFSGSHRYVADYLIREVFESQPPAMQAFLLNTCFLDRLTGPLCDSIHTAGNAESLLEQLDREGLFLVRLDQGQGRAWYRYNPLFAESVQSLAHQRLGEAGVRAIFEKASAWYEYQNMFAEAVEAALSARQFERALALIEVFIDLHSLGELRTLGRWIEAIPTGLTFRRPEVCLAYAQVILYTSDRYAPATALRIEPYLQAAEDAWHAAGSAYGAGRVGAVSALRGMMYQWLGEFEKSFAFVHRSLAELPEQDVFWRGVSLLNAGFEAIASGQMFVAQDRILEARALLGASQNIHGVLAAMQFLSEVFFWQGDLDQCAQLCREILAEAIGGEEMLDDQGYALAKLASVFYEKNELDAAWQRAAQALELATRRANQTLQAQAVICMAQVDAARGDFASAQERLKTFVMGMPASAELRPIQGEQALLAIRSGEMASLDGWQSLLAVEKANLLTLQKERQAFTLARLRIVQGNPGETPNLLQPWQEDAARQGRLRSQVEGWCIETLAAQAGGDLPHARAGPHPGAGGRACQGAMPPVLRF